MASEDILTESVSGISGIVDAIQGIAGSTGPMLIISYNFV